MQVERRFLDRRSARGQEGRLAKRGGFGHDRRRGGLDRHARQAVKTAVVPMVVRTLIAQSRKENRASPDLVLVRTPFGPSCAVRYSQASGHVLPKGSRMHAACSFLHLVRAFFCFCVQFVSSYFSSIFVLDFFFFLHFSAFLHFSVCIFFFAF